MARTLMENGVRRDLTADEETARDTEETAWTAKAPARASDQAKVALGETDKDMGRLLEDLLTLLETKGVMVEADLPKAARDKLSERRTLRSQI